MQGPGGQMPPIEYRVPKLFRAQGHLHADRSCFALDRLHLAFEDRVVTLVDQAKIQRSVQLYAWAALVVPRAGP